MTANSIAVDTSPTDLAEIVEEFKDAWRHGRPPDAIGAFREFPAILTQRSLAIDLAYEEYCIREEAGKTPDTESFCEALPAFQSQMREVIRGHRELADHPEILANAPATWPAVGDKLDGYPLVRELGRGAFARVFLAVDQHAGGRPVVLKMSKLPSAEACTLGPIDHKNVVGVLWAKQIDGLFVICMPFVAAMTLQDAIDLKRTNHAFTAGTLLTAIDHSVPTLPLAPTIRDRVPDPRHKSWAAFVIAIAQPLASALAYLHGRGICHGDLKPSNILLGPGGVAYLIDFNLASSNESAGLRMGGTLPYMAPERIRAMLDRTLDASPANSADVYSFGAVLFECLTGRPPLLPRQSTRFEEIAEEMLAKSVGKRSDLREQIPGISSRLARLIEQCLDPNPQLRPSAKSISIELDKQQKGRNKSIRRLTAVAAVFLAIMIVGQRWAAPSQSVSERAYAPRIVDVNRIADPFERGMAHLKAEEIDSAIKAFGDARRANPADGRTYAYLGYAYTRAGRHEIAVENYRLAISSGFDQAWVRNNRAYSLTQFNRFSSTNLPVALDDVSRARQMAPQNRGIQFNWAYIRFLSKFDSKTKRLKDDECVSVLRDVMAEGPCDAELYYKAAIILAASSKGDECCRTAIEYLKKAIELGKLPKLLAGDPVLKANLGRRQDFSELLALSPGTRANSRLHLELVNPAE